MMRSAFAARSGVESRPCGSCRAGFTLIEMLCVIMLLAVLAGAMAFLLRETLQTERLLTESFDTLLQTSTLADEFRSDVSRAESAPQQWQEHQAGPRTLILQMPDGGHVVYVHAEDGWQRRAVEEGKVSVRGLPLSRDDVDAEFVRGATNPRLVFFRLQRLHRGSVLPGQTLEIAAALGGDLR